MDLTFILSAAIFTLLAIVVATSLLNGSSSAADCADQRRLFGHRGDAGPRQNGHVPDPKAKEKKDEDDWCEISGSSHDHWDVVKSVLSEEAHPHPHTEELATPVEHSSSTSTSLETEGATESPGLNDKAGSDENDSLKYIPGKARSHHLQMMMSTEEMEEEQRVQREQLAAIFQLLKENKETFGEVSEGDMEEQLRLYSI
ncbi:uncharacterized protein LOC121625149 isoform X2 [Chelmon rostratus]|uniref:uncharacterized protein LOC121625149 isoform X2 n=1 Tax=Chelmon rostratus TaxID=109905 RepID=UPI001BE504C3|nr:uncharacterized protein LOC121625149 isoform X2 [Chelmon rostratus]